LDSFAPVEKAHTNMPTTTVPTNKRSTARTEGGSYEKEMSILKSESMKLEVLLTFGSTFAKMPSQFRHNLSPCRQHLPASEASRTT
jgi:hypothetical protein